MSSAENRFKKIPLDSFLGFNRATRILTDSGWDDAEERARNIFSGFGIFHLAFLPLLGIEDSIVHTGYQRLSKFPISAWTTPSPEHPYSPHLWKTEIELESGRLFENISLDQAQSDMIDWENLTYKVNIRTSGRGAFGDIEGYEFVIGDVGQSRNCITIMLNELGLIISNVGESEILQSVETYFRENPAHTSIFIGKAVKETLRILENRLDPK